MASVTKRGRKSHMIQFTLDGARKTIHLGESTRKDAKAVAHRIDDLVNARTLGQPVPHDTAAWLVRIASTDLYAKLAGHGLAAERIDALLGPVAQEFIDSYRGKDSSRLVMERGRNHLLQHFGADRDMRTITEAEADEWFDWMVNEREPLLAMNTARKSVSIARQIWAYAKKRGLVTDHPFGDLSATVKGNRLRMCFVTREQTQAIIDKAPDTQWRLLIALARYGGLRIPSDLVNLRWEHVDWERSRFTVHSTKTEHHEDGGIREVPIFPELRPYLQDAHELATPGTAYVLPVLRHQINHRTLMLKLIRRAGLKPWPKVFQNLRASRETELLDQFPIHVVCAWIGNTPQVALRHYAMARPEHYEAALHNALQTGAESDGLHQTEADKPETKKPLRCRTRAVSVRRWLSLSDSDDLSKWTVQDQHQDEKPE